MAGEAARARARPAATSSASTEDLSEYTDADESISAPTEFFAEFLSSLMLKDYNTALKYCKLILHYESNNATAKEFLPLILEKLRKSSLEKDPGTSPSTSGDDAEPKSLHSESDSSSESEDGEISESEKEEEPSYEGNEANNSDISAEENSGELGRLGRLNLGGLGSSVGGDKQDNISTKSLNASADSDGTTNSYSSLEDEEVTRDDNILEEVIVEDNYADDDNGNAVSYKQRKAPNVDNCSFNWFTKIKEKNSNTTAPLTGTSFQTSSDSESPTDPVTQQTIQMLRAKFVHATN